VRRWLKELEILPERAGIRQAFEDLLDRGKRNP